MRLEEVDALAVTCAPGLIGALLVGDAMFRLFSPAPALVYADRRQMEDSVAKIWALHPTALYFGHGRPAQGL